VVDQRAVQPAHVDPVQILDDRRDRYVRQVPPARSGAHPPSGREGRKSYLRIDASSSVLLIKQVYSRGILFDAREWNFHHWKPRRSERNMKVPAAFEGFGFRFMITIPNNY
jgi:hypothetical protein